MARREVITISPSTFSEVEGIVRSFRNRVSVIVDFSDLPNDIGRRILDFLSGAVFSLNGTIDRIKYKQYILIPEGVKIKKGR